jgi:3-hydroxyisobutyrate dehydrogenase-like beta-hydroxyacid dehydrogenase
METAFIGFGEAGRTFGAALRPTNKGALRAYDRKARSADTVSEMEAACANAGVTCARTLGGALSGADLIISVVTAEQAFEAADQAAAHLGPGALFCDMNSVAPETKRRARAVIEQAGGRYVDVAIMAPVLPAALSVPLLASGPHAPAAQSALGQLGFQVRIIDGQVGAASAIKMVRSIMVKGIEALTAECLLSARKAGVETEVIASLVASSGNPKWADQADYNLDRMLVHGLRRAAEMDESSRTAASLGTRGSMAAATADWQRRLGTLGVDQPPIGLVAKLDLITQRLGASNA